MSGPARPRGRWGRLRRRLGAPFFRIGLVLAALGIACVPLPTAWVDGVYAKHLYPTLQRALTGLSSTLPVALADVGVIAALVVVVALCAGAVRRTRSRGLRHALGVTLWHLVVAAAAIYLVFMLAWGLNYQRRPLRDRLDASSTRVTDEAARLLADRLTERLNVLHDSCQRTPWPDWEAMPDLIGPAFHRVQRQLLDVTPARPAVPKRSGVGLYLQRAGATGVTNPFGLEVLVDPSLLPVERPMVAAHEWAHLAGYAAESEANFVGWLVCLQSPGHAEYSGGLDLLVYLLDALPPAERQHAVASLARGPRDDLRAIGRRVAANTWPWLQRPAWWLYDRYLRANRVEQGVRSYGAALELMLSTRFSSAWVPRRREP